MSWLKETRSCTEQREMTAGYTDSHLHAYETLGDEWKYLASVDLQRESEQRRQDREREKDTVVSLPAVFLRWASWPFHKTWSSWGKNACNVWFISVTHSVASKVHISKNVMRWNNKTRSWTPRFTQKRSREPNRQAWKSFWEDLQARFSLLPL